MRLLWPSEWWHPGSCLWKLHDALTLSGHDCRTNCPMGVMWRTCDCVFDWSRTEACWNKHGAARLGSRGPWSVCGLFLKTQPGHCIFYSYADWHPEKGARQLICQSAPRGHVSSWSERKRKSYRLLREPLFCMETTKKGRARLQRTWRYFISLPDTMDEDRKWN